MNPQNLDNETPSLRDVAALAAILDDGNNNREDATNTNTPSLTIMMMNNIAAEEESKKSKSKKKKKRKNSNKLTSTNKNKTDNLSRKDGEFEEEQQRGQSEGSSSQLNELSPPIISDDNINSEDVTGPQSQKSNTSKKKKRKSSKKLSTKKLEHQPDIEARQEERVSRLELAMPVNVDKNIHEEDNAAIESKKKLTPSKKKKRKSRKKISTKNLEHSEEKEFENEKKREKQQQNRIKLATSVYLDDNAHEKEDKIGMESKKLNISTTAVKTKKSKKKLNHETDENIDMKDGSHSSMNSKISKHQSRHRARVRVPFEEEEDSMGEASFDLDDAPGAHHIGGMRDSVDVDTTMSQLDPPEREERPQDSTETTDYTEEHQVTTAHVVDEEALEREFTDRKVVEIRNQILSDAAAATEVKREKTFLQKYGVLCGCALIAVLVTIILSVTLSDKDGDPEPLVGYDYLLDLLSSISDISLLLNETTPQYDALNWLAFEDTVGIPLAESNSELLANSLEERYVVALLFFATQGTNWTNSYDFLANTSICEWPRTITDDNETLFDGIRCNEGGFVDSVSLESNNMDGTLPSEIQALESLQTLSLANNALHGQLPPGLGDMPNLRRLSLHQNSLTGEIPQDFGGLLGLEELSLALNSLHGSLPSQVTLLPRLQEILLGRNFLTGSIPEFLPRGPMRRIKIGFNMFSGSLPGSIYQLSSLEELDLYSNDLTGTISSKIGNLVSMKMVLLWLNNFEGGIPSQIGELDDLIILDVGTNGLSHTIPTELGELGRLKQLNLEENALSGTIPSEVQYLSNLWYLDLSSNQISGLVPLELGTLESLRDGVVDLHNNSLTGSLDSVFCDVDESGLLPPITLKADCGEIDCSCCTDCCDDPTGYCAIEVDEICERKIYEAENFLSLESWGTACSCRDGGAEGGKEEDGFTYLDCSDTCRSCNPEGKFCLEKYRYGFDIPESTGLDNLFSCNMRYIPDETAPYRNEDISFRIDYYIYECSVSINGTPCNTCLADRKCDDGFTGLFVDCSNIEADAVYDDCSPGLNGGELLQFLRPEYFAQECPPCIFL